MKKVAILCETYGTDSQLGALRYGLRNAGWKIRCFVAHSGNFDHVLPWKPHGIIDDTVNPVIKEQVHEQWGNRGIPLVDITWDMDPNPKFPSVCINSPEIGRIAANYFLNLGLKSFGFVGHPDLLYSRLRFQGFNEVLKEHNLEARPYLNAQVFDESEEPLLIRADSERELIQWVRTFDQPTGIFAANDRQAFQFLQICLSRNQNIANSHAVIGADNHPFYCEAVRPSISSIPTPIGQVGQAAARLLDDLLKSKEPEKRLVVLDPLPVIARESTQIRNSTDEKLGIVLRYIDDHLHRKINSTELARLIDVSVPTLNKRFRQHLGKSPLQEIHYRRFEKAKRLLRETNLTVADIAKQCAFGSSARFCIAFKKNFSETPSTFREYFDR